MEGKQATKVSRKRSRDVASNDPENDKEMQPTIATRKAGPRPNPTMDIRYDNIGHYPALIEKRQDASFVRKVLQWQVVWSVLSHYA